MPTSIQLDETLGMLPDGTFRSVIDDALDDGDDGDDDDDGELNLAPPPEVEARKPPTESTESDEESSNHSQASSTAEGKVKKLAKQAKNMTGV